MVFTYISLIMIAYFPKYLFTLELEIHDIVWDYLF